jgi:membrane protein DedA with SNARE-associated domain
MDWVLDSLEALAGSPWAYALILAVAAVDAFFPVVPSEATVVTAGVFAAVGDLTLAFVIAAGAAGALAGDTTSYAGGRLLSRRIGPWLERTPARQRQSDRARRLLARRGAFVVLGARFVPGGRTAVTLTAGAIRFRFLRFGVYAVVAATLWATYAGLVGYLGGRAFAEQPLLAVGAALGGVALVALLVEGVRRLRVSPCAAC